MTKQLQPNTNNSIALRSGLPIAGSSSLESYIAYVNHIPLLTFEEEQTLASNFFHKQDMKAARELLLSHLRFVVRVARGYMGYGLALGDLIQEGNIGLMKAIKRFDPTVGVRLVSFAVHWVKAEIHEFILRNWRIVKIATTKAQRKLFFNLRKATRHLTSLNDTNINTIATDLSVNPEEVRQMHERLSHADEAFDKLTTGGSQEDASSHYAPEHYLADQRYNPALQLEAQDWADNREANLQQAISSLDARSQAILTRRWLAPEKATLHELAAEYQVSAERIRQLEKIAMDKLKQILMA